MIAIVLALAAIPETAAAHTSVAGSGPSAKFALSVAVALGLLTGLLSVQVSGEGDYIPTISHQAIDMLLTVGFLILGSAFLISGITNSPILALAGTAVGGGAAVFTVYSADASVGCGCTSGAKFAVSGIAAHRIFEGAALGTAIAVGGRVGLIASALVVGHTAVEAGLLGAAYGVASQFHGIAVVAIIQLALVCGAVIGATAVESIPQLAKSVILALSGGALVVVGAERVRRLCVTLTY